MKVKQKKLKKRNPMFIQLFMEIFQVHGQMMISILKKIISLLT